MSVHEGIPNWCRDAHHDEQHHQIRVGCMVYSCDPSRTSTLWDLLNHVMICPLENPIFPASASALLSTLLRWLQQAPTPQRGVDSGLTLAGVMACSLKASMAKQRVLSDDPKPLQTSLNAGVLGC